MPPWVPVPVAAPPPFPLEWSSAALEQLAQIRLEFYATNELDLFRLTISNLLALNPRSQAWKQAYGTYYYVRYDRVTLHFTFSPDGESACVDRVAETQMDAVK
jgi:hypothetical protein